MSNLRHVVMNIRDYGEVKFEWDGREHTESRANCFDVPPTALHADRATAVRIECLSDEAEIKS